MSAPAANVNAKKSKGVSCQPLGPNGKAAGNAVSFNVRPRSANSVAAPTAAAPMAAANAAKKAEVDAIVAEINTAAATVTKANLDQFNALLRRYMTAMPGATEVKVIPTDIAEDTLAKAVEEVVAAVKNSAPKAGGGRRKTHRKKRSMRSMHSKRHCKTHKKHGGKRSTKHHKKHGKTRGKRSKTHKKRHHKKH
jgi:hypothetical protein